MSKNSTIALDRIEILCLKMWRETKTNLQHFRLSLNKIRMQFMHITLRSQQIEHKNSIHNYTLHIFVTIFLLLFFVFHLLCVCNVYAFFAYLVYPITIHEYLYNLLRKKNPKICGGKKTTKKRSKNDQTLFGKWKKEHKNRYTTHQYSMVHIKLVLQRPWINLVNNFYDAYWNWYFTHTKLFILHNNTLFHLNAFFQFYLFLLIFWLSNSQSHTYSVRDIWIEYFTQIIYVIFAFNLFLFLFIFLLCVLFCFHLINAFWKLRVTYSSFHENRLHVTVLYLAQ